VFAISVSMTSPGSRMCHIVPSLGISKVLGSESDLTISGLKPVKNLDDKFLQDCRVKVLKLFDGVFLIDVVPFNSLIEFLKVHVSEKCSIVLVEYASQQLATSYSSSTSLSLTNQVDFEKLNSIYGKPLPRSYLHILGLLRLNFSGGAIDHFPISQDMLAQCYVDRASAVTFLTQYLLSSSIRQTTVGRILKLSHVFVFNDTPIGYSDHKMYGSDVLSGEGKVKHIEQVVNDTEVIISSVRSTLDDNIDVSIESLNGGLRNVDKIMSITSDRTLSKSIHNCMEAIDCIHENLKVVEMTVHYTGGGVQDISKVYVLYFLNTGEY
jgi:hypothetical protein